jgi:hypothetical protein
VDDLSLVPHPSTLLPADRESFFRNETTLNAEVHFGSTLDENRHADSQIGSEALCDISETTPAVAVIPRTLIVDLPESTLVNPRTAALGYEPPCPVVSEPTALALLGRTHKQLKEGG